VFEKLEKRNQRLSRKSINYWIDPNFLEEIDPKIKYHW